jgi:arabinofuranosyltransferase
MSMCRLAVDIDRPVVARTILVLISTVFAIELVRTAWLSDDSLITLRVVLNFINGYGPVFNVAERVQAYTHPLWFLLIALSTLLFGNPFVATFVLSIGLSCAAVSIFPWRLARSTSAGLLAVTALMLSKAFVDYSTSGLENPLAHLLLLWAVILGIRARKRFGAATVAAFFMCCSLLYLTRPDLVLFMIPPAALIIAEHRRSIGVLATAFLAGAVPAVAWTIFSLFYYGFPFPNTAYAKLGTGLPHQELIRCGIHYLIDSLVRDPITLGVILIGCVYGLLSDRFDRALAGGILTSLVYVVGIGGDFMSGRFLSVPLLAACVLIARTARSRRILIVTAAVVFLLGIPNLRATLLSGVSYENKGVDADGIADERGFYFQQFGLLPAPPGTFSDPDWNLGEHAVLVVGRLGAEGLERGPGTHLIDVYALADALLARLPVRLNPDWRIGHFARQIPTDYVSSVDQDSNLLADPATANLYAVLRRITRDPLSDAERLRAILDMNLGRVPEPDPIPYALGVVPRSSRPPRVDVRSMVDPTASFSFGPAQSEKIGIGGHVEIELPGPMEINTIEMSLGGDDYYEVGVALGREYSYFGRVFPSTQDGFPIRRTFDVGDGKFIADRVWIMALAGDGLYIVENVRLPGS